MSEHAARLVVSQRSLGRCECCGAEGTNVHHRRKAGRVWVPSNLLRLCGSGTTGCHGLIEANPMTAGALGLWVPSSGDPATEPVLCRPVGWWAAWWLLNDDGTLAWQDDPTDAQRAAYGELFPHSNVK